MSNSQFNLADFLPYQLSITSNAVSNKIARKYRDDFGLKVTEWRIMANLADLKSATQRELTAGTLMDKVAVNRACKVLEQRGLAVRLPNRKDGRSHHLELTQEGRAMHSKIVPVAREVERKLLETLGEEQEQILRDLLEQIRIQAE